MTSGFEQALQAWRSLLGEANVIGAEQASFLYGADTGGLERRIPAALKPRDSAQLSALMCIASEYKVPVYPVSTGRNWGYGTALPARHDCVLLDLSGLDQILHFDAELGVVTVQPGVTQGQLADFLRDGGHPFMVPNTGAGPSTSLLGNALERGYGVTPHTDHFAAVTDLEAVLADGSIYRTALNEAGGEDIARLFKWGIGAHSAGLFTQSGFGIVTRMSIVLARRPEMIKVCLFSLKDDSLLEPAVERIHEILGRLPGIVGAINIMNRHRVLAMSAPYPAGQAGPDGLLPPELIAQLGKQYQIMPWTCFGTLYGTRRVVKAAQREIRAVLKGVASRLLFLSQGNANQLASLAKLLPGAGGARLASTANTLAQALELASGQPNETALPLAYWRNPRPHGGGPRDPARDGCGLLWYAPLVPMRGRQARAYVEMVQQITRKHGIEPLLTFTSLNDRVFDSTVPLLFDRSQPQAVAAAHACYEELLAEGKAHHWFPYRVGISTMPALRAAQQDAPGFHDRLQAALDPHGLIAPGRYR